MFEKQEKEWCTQHIKVGPGTGDFRFASFFFTSLKRDSNTGMVFVFNFSSDFLSHFTSSCWGTKKDSDVWYSTVKCQHFLKFNSFHPLWCDYSKSVSAAPFNLPPIKSSYIYKVYISNINLFSLGLSTLLQQLSQKLPVLHLCQLGSDH